MSADVSPLAGTAPIRAGKRKSLQSGFSLLARGEPQIWFTGGMLAICLTMIVGLLSFILYAGLPTFWPTPVHLLVINDGSLAIGQPERQQAGEVESNRPEEIPGTLVDDGLSRYYRTANFDLTSQHYRWLAPWELGSGGITTPPWAVVVERLEYGRRYGLINEFAQAMELDESTAQELFALERLSELFGGLPEVPPELLTDVLTAIESRQGELRDAAWRSEVQNLNESAGTIQIQTTAEEGWIAPSAADGSARWTNARHLINTDTLAEAELQAELLRVHRQREQAERLAHRISRLDAQIADLRADVRRAELDTNVTLAQQIDSADYLLEQLEALAARQATWQSAMDLMRQIAEDEQWQEEAETLLESYRSSTLQEQLTEHNEMLAEWMQPIETQPLELAEAVRDYQTGYRRIIRDKRPLFEQLEQVRRSLARSELSLVLPHTPVELELAEEDLFALREGNLTTAAREQLSMLQIESASDRVSLERMNEQLSIASLLDQHANRHRLAIVYEGYLPGSERSGWRVYLLQEDIVPCEQIVRAVPANRLSFGDKLAVYFSRWGEFLWENPREANSEGGVFPAIWGTIVMTLIMTVIVVPFGIMAALYLREYTRSGPLVSLIRISINNLAGVPSIVYGVFGLSFFCYTIGAFVDGGPRNADIAALPRPAWFLALAAVGGLGTIAFFFSFLSSGPGHSQSRRQRLAGRAALGLWVLCVAGVAWLILKSPFFEGFFREYLPNPTFGKGGLLWAALTLALLTLPVVIVATEEALAAVPNSLREGSLACGASKWQTIRRIILPHARPGILTGAILAMARGAGEVAPLMLVGVLASAPDLPLDTEFPYFHGSRSFMHLGYQIYTLGFQSQNSEASKPMVFTCTLLLILIVATLNLSAIYLRARLKRRFKGTQF